MTRRLVMLASLVVAVAFVLPASASVAGAPTLTGVVGPGYTISLKDAGGNAVTNLAPGDYVIDITDNSNIHNFHLTGPNVDTATKSDETGEIEWNLHFAAGTYTFFCDAHPDTMTGSFTVGSAAASPPPAPPPPPPPAPPPPPPPPSPAVAPSPPPAAAAVALTGNVGPGFSISLVDASGSAVKHLDQGTYTITVHDKSDNHNFHLFGPGVDQATSVDTSGDATWTVTLTDGVYTYQCDAHPTTMVAKFAVGSATVSPPPAPPPPPPPPTKPGGSKLPKLAGSVGPGYTIKLSGPKVKRAGSYRLTISDRASIHDFHLVGTGVNKKTGVGFKGTVTWTVKLKKKSTYRYWCDPHKKLMKGSFRTK